MKILLSRNFIRINNLIKIASAILDKEIDEILHLDSKNQRKVFETSNYGNPKPSFDLTFEPVIFNFLEEPSCFDHSEDTSYFICSKDLPKDSL